MFVAITFAKMLAPQGRLYGADCRIRIGIVQLVALIIPDYDPSQLDNYWVYVTPSFCWILIEYADISDPPLKGGDQVIVTETFEFTEVEGVAG